MKMPKKDIEELVNYLYEDEARHYEESDKPSKHIFRNVRRVEKWLSQSKKKN